MAGSRVSLGGIALWALTALAAAGSIVLIALDWNRTLAGDLFGGVGGIAFSILGVAFATVGAMVASRVPRNAVGWILIAIGVLTCTGILAYEWAAYGVTVDHGLAGTTVGRVGVNAARRAGRGTAGTVADGLPRRPCRRPEVACGARCTRRRGGVTVDQRRVSARAHGGPVLDAAQPGRHRRHARAAQDARGVRLGSRRRWVWRSARRRRSIGCGARVATSASS